jgi:hypothetical protein
MIWAPHTSPSSAVNVDCILDSIQSFLSGLGFGPSGHAAALWVFFAACGVTELAISFLICTPLERFWPLTGWPKRNSIAADVSYAFFVRIVLFPLIAYFEFNWLRQSLDGVLQAHGMTPPSLPALIPVLASWARRWVHRQLRRSRSRRLLASPYLSQDWLVVWDPLPASCRRAVDVLVR